MLLMSTSCMIGQRIGVVTDTRIPPGGPRVALAQPTMEELSSDNAIDNEPEKGRALKVDWREHLVGPPLRSLLESALDLAADPDRRMKFRADVQDYVDMSISSTINLPAWGSDLKNPDTVEPFAQMLAKYAHRLRDFTFHADGSRGGQPLTAMSYSEASNRRGEEIVETHDICDITGLSVSCGV